MKIALLDVHNDDYNQIAGLSWPSKSKYCKKKGYDFLTEKIEELDRKPNWGRILGLKKHLSEYDWILYLDTDIIINNFDISMEDQISDKSLKVGRMPNTYNIPTHISTSAILIKNCEWSFKFLDFWWDQKEWDQKPYYSSGPGTAGDGGYFLEQSAFHYIYENFDEHRKNISVGSQWFNARYQFCTANDFLAHFARPNELHGSLPYDKAGLMRRFISDRLI